eukprot:366130-Chlamydomonas_euryale.AAC.54
MQKNPFWTAVLPCRGPPRRQCTCQLELDGCVEDVLNRGDAQRTPLIEAGPDQQLLDSLVPMWTEERQRCRGNLPARPSSPPRKPEPLAVAVRAVAAQMRVRAAGRRRVLSLSLSPLLARR